MSSDPESLFQQACRLMRQGLREEAKEAFLHVLKQAPGHFGALNNLGAVLNDMGYRSAARTAYARAAAQHPDNPVGHVNLANALRADGDLAAAKAHCETALRLSPAHAGAHRAMAGILFDLGETSEAARHRNAGFKNHDTMTIPFQGKGKAVRLLMLVSAVGGNVPIRHLIDDTFFETTVIYADYWKRPLPPHDIAFNAIGDADLCRAAMQDAIKLLSATGASVLNSPSVALRTSRMENAARMANIEGVRTARTVLMPRETLCGPSGPDAVTVEGLRLPLLLRSPGFHTGQHFERADTFQDISATAARLPGSDLLAMDYLDARGADGMARKYRVMFVDGAILPLHLAISQDWKVHYFTAAMAQSQSYRAEEARFLNDMPGTIGANAMSALGAIRDALGLDYAGIDFGLNAAGELLLFEANATMIILPPAPDPCWDYRRAAIGRVEAAVRTMLIRRAAAGTRRAA